MTEEGAPQEPEEPQEPQDEPQDPQPEPAPEPSYVTKEDLESFMEKHNQKLQSWIGRRDAELFEKIKERKPPDPDQAREKMLEDPTGFFKEMQSRAERERATHMQGVLAKAGGILESDPLYEDAQFGNEVVKEIKSMAPTIDVSMNPSLAAEMLVSKATLAVERRNRTKKKNPLEKNTPQNTATGVTPPAGGPKKKPTVKLESDLAKRMAKKWGYKEEDLAKVLG